MRHMIAKGYASASQPGGGSRRDGGSSDPPHGSTPADTTGYLYPTSYATAESGYDAYAATVVSSSHYGTGSAGGGDGGSSGDDRYYDDSSPYYYDFDAGGEGHL